MYSSTTRALQVWEQLEQLTAFIVQSINRKHVTNVVVSHSNLQKAFELTQSYMRAAFDFANDADFVDAYETFLRELCFNLVNGKVFTCLTPSRAAFRRPMSDLIADLIEHWASEFVPLMVCDNLLGRIVFEHVKRRYASPINVAQYETLLAFCERLAEEPQAALDWIESIGYPKLP